MKKVIINIIMWLKEILIGIAIVLIFNIFFVASTVYNISMYSTLEEGDVVLMLRTQNVAKGDIVSFRSHLVVTESDLESVNFIQRFFNKPGDRKNLIKRVIAEPGDLVRISDGRVYLNGSQLAEPYVREFYEELDFEEQRVPEGHYFVLGDNRPHSLDSRSFGFIKKEDIIGKTIFRFWPLNKLGKP